MDVSLITLILISVFFTSLLSGFLGMVGGMILMGILSFCLPIPVAMIVHGTSQLTANGSRAFFLMKHIHRRILLSYCLGTLLSVGLFTLISFIPNKMLVFLILGLLPFLNSVLKHIPIFKITSKFGPFVCGVLVTFFQLLSGVSGAMLDIFYLNTPLNKYEIVANKAFTQTIGHTTKVIYFGLFAFYFGGNQLSISLWTLFLIVPFAITGTYLGKQLLDKISNDKFLSLTKIAVMGIGLLYLFQAANIYFSI